MSKKFLQKIQFPSFHQLLPWFLALLSGILVGGCFPPLEWGLAWLPWVALTPLFWALWMLPRPATLNQWGGKAFLLGWLSGSIAFLISFFWITTVTWLGWIILCLIVALYHGLATLFAGVVLRPLGEGSDQKTAWLGDFRNLAVALLTAASWVAFEWLRGTLFTGFGWNQLGLALRSFLPIIQITSITGTFGLTFLCVLSSSILAITLERLRREITSGKTRPHIDFFAVLFFITLLFIHGVKKITSSTSPASTQETTSLRVAGAQGNIPVYDYWNPKYESRILESYLRQSQMALALNPDLLVWPEAATPQPLLLDEITFNAVKDLALGTHADFLIGSVHYERAPRGDYNSAILLTNHAGHVQIYNKVHLVPFGEYVPFRHTFPVFSWIVGKRIPYDFDPGKGPGVLDLSVKPVKIAPLICFEDTLGDQTRRAAALGAQLLITITNDGWFEHSAATQQHLANAQLRTVETGLPMIRVGDTGISCMIDRFGKIRERLQGPDGNTFIAGILQANVAVPLHPVPTFYTRHGDLFAHACLGATLAAIAAAFLVARRQRK